MQRAGILDAYVAAGTAATWIIMANSWMQTPTGHTMGADGRFAPADWWAIIFNPSFPYRLVHVLLASALAAPSAAAPAAGPAR